MTKFLRIALPLIAAMAATGIASQASAMNIYNCAGMDIRVHVYDNADSVQAIARAGGYIYAGQGAYYDVGGGQMALKIFQTGFFDQMRLSVSNVSGNGSHSVRTNTQGRWSLEDGRSC
jgi:hypothetical protein